MMQSAKMISAIIVAVVLPVLGACRSEPLDMTEDEAFVFLTQEATPLFVMEALFEGRVQADARGCIRLESVDDATVVWPAGFRLVRDGTHLEIRDADDRRVGRLGGRFRLGGGEVTELHDGLGLSASARQRAANRCPGRFWIVGDVLS